MSTETVQLIPITQLSESANNPRQHFDTGKLKELTASIKERGIIVPLLVRAHNGKYEIVAGARRFRAAIIAGLTEIRCLVRDLSDEQALEVQVIENLQREDVHPLDEAVGYATLIAASKKAHAKDQSKPVYDVDAIAAKVGKSTSYVYQRLKLSELIDAAKKAFWSDRITASHAILIARLQPKDQQRAMAFAVKTWQGYDGQFEYDNPINPEPKDQSRDMTGQPARAICSVKDLENFIALRIHLDLKDAAFDKKDAQLVPAAGACINCPKRTGFNKELFNDIARLDTCTDPCCFAAKQEANLEALKVQLKKEKKKFVELTEDRVKPESHKQSITERSFKAISGRPCKYARVGIYIDGSNKGKTASICNEKKKCKQHWGEYQKQRSAYQSSPSEPHKSYEEQERLRKEKQEKAWRKFTPIAEEIWRRVPTKLPEGWEARIAKMLNISSDLEQAKPRGLNLTPIQFINLALLSMDFRIDVSWDGAIHPDLYKAAKKLGIKFEAILQKISDEEKAAAKSEANKKMQTSAKAEAKKKSK